MTLRTKTFFKFLFPLIILSFLSTNCTKEIVKVDYKPSHPEWSKNVSIYELNVRQYTEEGNFAAFEEKLPELKKLGVGIIWFMPIHPIGELNRKGELGSYYAVKDFKAVNPEFGTIEEFKSLVQKIHDMGMYVIIDWVANHTAWDNVWTETNPEFFNKDSLGNFFPPVSDWSDVIDLNYDEPTLHDAMIDALKFWIRECNIDGYRCDVAAMVPTEFWERARKELDKIKPVFMLAEANESHLHPAFDMTYNWPLLHEMNEIGKGKKKASDLVQFFTEQKKEYRPDDYRMVFTTNHDENSWNETVFERYGEAAEALAAMCGTVSGMPLIYSGQEVGLNKALSFFDKDLIDWKDHKFRGIYTNLNKLKKENKALWNGEAGGEMQFIETGNENVFAFLREKDDDLIIALFNLSSEDQTFSYLLDSVNGEFTDFFEGSKVTITQQNVLQLQPWSYKVYLK